MKNLDSKLKTDVGFTRLPKNGVTPGVFIKKRFNQRLANIREFLSSRFGGRKNTMSFYGTGFTLMEILIVISIVGILSSIVISSTISARESAKIAKTQAMVKQIRTAISLLEGDTNQWPGHKTIEDVENGASGNEIWDLNAPSAGLVATDGNFPNWNGPYISHIPPDPWGNNYFFDTDYDADSGGGTTWAVAVGSFGPNGQGQNVYDSDNIFQIIVSD